MDDIQAYYALVTRVFVKLAPIYDLIALPAAGVRESVVRFTNAPGGSRILDVATGTGAQALAFGRRGYEVTGIDLSEAMLDVARKKNRYGNVRFRAADATNLPFADDSFDIVCISFALHDMPLTIAERVLKEMVRVTRPDGRFVIVDYGLPQHRVGRVLIYRLVSLYEGEYYTRFIRANLREVLHQAGIEIHQERTALLGAARMLKGAAA